MTASLPVEEMLAESSLQKVFDVRTVGINHSLISQETKCNPLNSTGLVLPRI